MDVEIDIVRIKIHFLYAEFLRLDRIQNAIFEEISKRESIEAATAVKTQAWIEMVLENYPKEKRRKFIMHLYQLDHRTKDERNRHPDTRRISAKQGAVRFMRHNHEKFDVPLFDNNLISFYNAFLSTLRESLKVASQIHEIRRIVDNLVQDSQSYALDSKGSEIQYHQQ